MHKTRFLLLCGMLGVCFSPHALWASEGQVCSAGKVFEIKFKQGDIVVLQDDHSHLAKGLLLEIIRVNTAGEFLEHREANNCCPGCPVYLVHVLDGVGQRTGQLSTCCQYFLSPLDA